MRPSAGSIMLASPGLRRGEDESRRLGPTWVADALPPPPPSPRPRERPRPGGGSRGGGRVWWGGGGGGGPGRGPAKAPAEMRLLLMAGRRDKAIGPLNNAERIFQRAAAEAAEAHRVRQSFPGRAGDGLRTAALPAR